MRKLGVRVVSAALAACMVASVLPVSAFAADGAGTTGTGTSTTLPADAQELPRSGTDIAGSYKISQDRSSRTVINTNSDVTIYITADVNYNNSGHESVLDVQSVGTLTIVNEGHTVNSNSTFLFVRSNATNNEIKVEGGTYQCGEKTAFNINHAGDVTLKNIAAQSDNIVVTNNGASKLTIDGGTYTGGDTDSTLLNNSTGTMVIKGAPIVTGTNTAVVNKEGTLTIDGGTYTSTNSAAVSNGINGTVTINGGSFTSDDKVLLNGGTMTINQTTGAVTSIKNKSGLSGAVINSGKLDFNGGTVTAPNGSGIHSVSSTAAVTTNINGGTITGCNAGISLQAGNLTVNLNNGVTLSSNTHDIVLREKQKIGGNYTGTASIRVFDPTTENDSYGRLLSDTVDLPFGANLVSHNYGYSVKKNPENNKYYLHRNDLHKLKFEKATAQKDDGTDTLKDLTSGAEVAAGTKVNLKANDPENDKQEFDKWEVTGTGDLSGILSDVKDPNAILTMPNQEVTVKATYKNKEHKLNYGENITATVNDTNVASGEDVAVDTQVKLEAKNSDDTKEFDKWVVTDASGNEITGTELDNILTVDSSDATKATLTMPNQAVTVEATYKTKQHKLTYDKATAKTEDDTDVANGDQVEVGTKVELKADAAPVNKVFDKWEVTNVSTDKVIDDLTGILDVNGINATLTMPNYPVHIEAKYKASENALTFDKATATVSGSTVTSGEQVAAGTKVSMKADLQEDEEFTGWTIKVKGEDKTDELLGSTAGDPDISFTMPDGNVEVTANHTTKKNPLNYEDAAATVGGNKVNSGDPVAVGTKVNLKANDPTDDTKEFDHWKVTDASGKEITGDALNKILSDANSADTTLTMPNYEVTIKPVTKTKTNPGTDPGDPSDPTKPGKPGEGDDDPDTPDTPDTPAADDAAVDPGCTIGGAVAAVIVGGTAAWGVYEAGTGIYRMMYMPGIILPTTRAELAMLIWEKADKPEPESDVLFEDIDEDNTDLQKAARWMVEQDLMDEKDDNKFLPGAHVTKLRVCTTWNDAREKGLID